MSRLAENQTKKHLIHRGVFLACLNFKNLAGAMRQCPNFGQELQMTKDISEEQCEKLKKILEEENQRTYTMEEVQQIGNDLIEFYEFLAELDAENET